MALLHHTIACPTAREDAVPPSSREEDVHAGGGMGAAAAAGGADSGLRRRSGPLRQISPASIFSQLVRNGRIDKRTADLAVAYLEEMGNKPTNGHQGQQYNETVQRL